MRTAPDECRLYGKARRSGSGLRPESCRLHAGHGHLPCSSLLLLVAAHVLLAPKPPLDPAPPCQLPALRTTPTPPARAETKIGDKLKVLDTDRDGVVRGPSRSAAGCRQWQRQ